MFVRDNNVNLSADPVVVINYLTMTNAIMRRQELSEEVTYNLFNICAFVSTVLVRFPNFLKSYLHPIL